MSIQVRASGILPSRRGWLGAVGLPHFFFIIKALVAQDRTELESNTRQAGRPGITQQVETHAMLTLIFDSDGCLNLELGLECISYRSKHVTRVEVLPTMQGIALGAPSLEDRPSRKNCLLIVLDDLFLVNVLVVIDGEIFKFSHHSSSLWCTFVSPIDEVAC